MNLNAYDNVVERIDKTKTWIDIKKKCLFSREINKRSYYCLLKRYDNKINSYSYYIALLDNIPKDRTFKYTKHDAYGRVKIYLSCIWSESYLSQFGKDCNINIANVEHNDDGDIYLLDV